MKLGISCAQKSLGLYLFWANFSQKYPVTLAIERKLNSQHNLCRLSCGVCSYYSYAKRNWTGPDVMNNLRVDFSTFVLDKHRLPLFLFAHT
jgi:hypothetical protein